MPKLSPAQEERRKEYKDTIAKKRKELMARKRVGEIRDYGKAKTSNFPEIEQKELIKIFKAVNGVYDAEDYQTDENITNE